VQSKLYHPRLFSAEVIHLGEPDTFPRCRFMDRGQGCQGQCNHQGQDPTYLLIEAEGRNLYAYSGMYVGWQEGVGLGVVEAAQFEQVFTDEPISKLSDGYHTFEELYDFRMAYNAVLFNTWAKHLDAGWSQSAAQKSYDVHKSWKHSDGEPCFGGGWFVVVAETPVGQITNHYKAEHWDLFDIPERETANKWDGHTAKEALGRMLALASVK
jgi:hypothetical protein